MVAPAQARTAPGQVFAPNPVADLGIQSLTDLWAFPTAVGAATADRVIVQAQFGFAADTSMPAAAATTIATAQRLSGTTVANAARRAFAAHGLA